MKWKKTVLSVVIFILLTGIVHAGGLGAGPGEIYFEEVLRGGYAERTITVSNPNDVPARMDISVDGSFKEWLTFDSGESFTVNAKSSFKFQAIVQPPDDIQNGVYNGSITIHSGLQRDANETGQFGMAIATAVRLLAFVEITGVQKLEYSVGSVTVRDTEVGYPIIFSVTGENKGNVITTLHVRIDIWDRDKTRILKSVDLYGDEALPTKKRADEFEVSSENLIEGQYWADVTVSVGDKIVAEESLTFDMLEEGSLTMKGELIHILSKVWVKAGEVVRIDAVFENIGELPTSAKFRGEVYLDDKLIKVIESDELDVSTGEKVNLTTYFTPEKSGRYVIRGVVVYSKKTTFPKEAILNVLPGKESITPLSAGRIILAVVIVIVGVFGVKLYKKRKKGLEKQ